MQFEKLCEELRTGLTGIAVKEAGSLSSVDPEDLIQEMLLYLWNRWKDRDLKGVTKSYILQGCWFHIRNLIRKNFACEKVISLEAAPGGSDRPLLETLSCDENSEYCVYGSYEFLPEDMSSREKILIRLAYEGYTLREAGVKLGVSHIMVFKILSGLRMRISG